jgi:hypothetical protein
MGLLADLRPVFAADNDEWCDVRADFRDTLPGLFWYAGAALDAAPLLALRRREFPHEVQNALSPNVFAVFTDYSSSIAGAFQRLYEVFDRADYSWQTVGRDYWFRDQLRTMDIEQLIPLTLFGSTELQRIRSEYPDFHPSVTDSLVPDDRWHFVYLELTWDSVDCRLFNTIRTSRARRPKVWIADERPALRGMWREIEPHGDDGYGVMHHFAADWERAGRPS